MAVIIYGIVNPASRQTRGRDDGLITVEIRRCAAESSVIYDLVNSFGFSSRALSFSVLSPSYPASRTNARCNDDCVRGAIR